MIDYDALIARVILREGGATYTNLSADAGGPTKYGITLATLHEWRQMPVSAEDVKDLTQGEAVRIYRARYFPVWFDLVQAEGCVELLFDFAVNSGVDISHPQKIPAAINLRRHIPFDSRAEAVSHANRFFIFQTKKRKRLLFGDNFRLSRGCVHQRYCGGFPFVRRNLGRGNNLFFIVFGHGLRKLQFFRCLFFLQDDYFFDRDFNLLYFCRRFYFRRGCPLLRQFWYFCVPAAHGRDHCQKRQNNYHPDENFKFHILPLSLRGGSCRRGNPALTRALPR